MVFYDIVVATTALLRGDNCSAETLDVSCLIWAVKLKGLVNHIPLQAICRISI